jgi:hypothetical protein
VLLIGSFTRISTFLLNDFNKLACIAQPFPIMDCGEAVNVQCLGYPDGQIEMGVRCIEQKRGLYENQPGKFQVVDGVGQAI